LWIGYRNDKNKVFLGERTKQHADKDENRPEYKVVDLGDNPATFAHSRFSPSLHGFRSSSLLGSPDFLYIAWKPEEPDVIKYQRSDAKIRFDFPEALTVEAKDIVSAPVLAVTSSEIWLSWLAGPSKPDGTYDIWLAESTDGKSWDSFNYSRQNRHAHTSYPPAFSARGDVLTIHWIDGTKVHSAEINPDETEFDTQARPPYPKVYDFTTIGDYGAETFRHTFPIGVAAAYGDDKRWLFVTTSDDKIWVLPPKHDGQVYALTDTPADAKSKHRAGAAFVELSPDRRNIFVTWKDDRDKNYREAKIHSVGGNTNFL